jgi:thiopeptide-type bacteriocin biosynthesis protein
VEVFATVAARSPEAIDAGAFWLVLREVRAVAPGAVAARFAEVLEPDGHAALRETVKAADPADGRLRAEAVCLPTRLSAANAVVHPPLRAWEVVLDAAPGVPAQRVIPLRELAVVLTGGRLAIVWPRADREVDLQEHTALNRTLLPAPLAALRLLSRDGQAIPGPHVHRVEHLPFVPRLVVGQIVVATARWHLDPRAPGQALPVDDAAAFAPALTEWRARWRMDRHVYLRSDDNRLLLDLDDAEQRDQLRQVLATADRPVTLEEALPGTGDAWLAGPRGRHAMELTATLRLEVPVASAPAAAAAGPVAAAERVRPPGGDWLYLKLYAPAATHEDLVAGPIRELCAEALAAGAADLWFFLRYHDPDPHVRVRLHGEPQQLAAELWPRLAPWLRALVDDGWCHRVALDTYEREVERYGGPEQIDRAERVFAADSQAVADLLRLRNRGRLRLERTPLAVASVDLLLQGLRLPAAERLAWAQRVRGHEAGERFRAEQGLLRRLLDEGLAAVGEEEAAAVLMRRSEVLRAQPVIDVSVPVAVAFAHMHCNRLLGTDRAAEAAVFELWARTVRSITAMQRVGRMSS